MGLGQSKEEEIDIDSPDWPIKDEKMSEFTSSTHFSPQDIQTLWLVYSKIGGSTESDKDGKIQFEEFNKHMKVFKSWYWSKNL